MVEAYFLSKLEELSIPAVLKSTISERLKHSLVNLFNKILAQSRQKLAVPVSKKFVEETPSAKTERLNLQKKSIRHKYFQEEQDRATKATAKTRGWKFSPKKNYRDFAELLQEEKEELMKQEQERIKKQRHNRLIQLQKTQKSRQKHQSVSVTNDYSYLKEKPLYIKMEESYFQTIEVPALEERKQKLAQIRDFNRKVNLEEIEKHQQWYTFNRSQQMPRSLPKYEGHFTERGSQLCKEDKSLLEQSNLSKIHRIKLKEKQNQYSVTVKQLHTPGIDICKSKEIELRLEKINNPVAKKIFPRKIEWKPRVYPKNPMVPSPKIPNESKVVNYLEEFKNNRKANEEDIEMASDQRKRILAASLEKEAQKIEYITHQSPVSKHVEINELLLKSTKAKMQVLENLIHN